MEGTVWEQWYHGTFSGSCDNGGHWCQRRLDTDQTKTHCYGSIRLKWGGLYNKTKRRNCMEFWELFVIFITDMAILMLFRKL